MLKAFVLSFAAALALAVASPALAAQPYPVNFHTFKLGTADTASTSGVTYSDAGIALASRGLGSFAYTDPYAYYAGDTANGSGTYDTGTWTSPWYSLKFPFNELVSSWNASTTSGTWIQVEMQPQLDNGHVAKWYILGRWTYSNADFHRTSVGGQGDADGYVAIDTFYAKDHPAVAYRLRVTLLRRSGTTATPTVTRLSAIASNLTNQKNQFPSPSTIKSGRDLQLPQYSQEIHHGEYPQFDGGGEAWCSPTSTSMVVAYWGKSPITESARIPYTDPWVDYTAMQVFDFHYDGAGNWPFNTAYAAARGLTADVTQLHSLRDAEPFIEAGVPLVASIAFSSNKLDGADIKSTNGHLVVIGGFTDGGKQVIVYDPASPDDLSVRHVYDREQFERAWIPGSGGIVYVDRPSWMNIDNLLTANNS